MLTIWISILIKPSLVSGTYENNVPWSEKVKSLKTNIWIILLFILVMGGIYIGFFTATEAAGFGALGALLVALLRKN